MKQPKRRKVGNEKIKVYRENAAFRLLFREVFGRDKIYKRELATMRANFAEHLYNHSEPI